MNAHQELHGVDIHQNIYRGLPVDVEKKMSDDIAVQVSAFQKMEFSKHKEDIKKLSLSDKMAWYALQNPQEIISLGNNAEFKRFWKWRVVLPIKAMRFYFRVKNLEIFKKHAHISDIKRKPGPELI